jgi:hypothetical protein
VTGSVILSVRYRGVTVPSCEIKRGDFGVQKVSVPVNKASLFKFHDVECSTRDCDAQRGCSSSVSSHRACAGLGNCSPPKEVARSPPDDSAL